MTLRKESVSKFLLKLVPCYAIRIPPLYGIPQILSPVFHQKTGKQDSLLIHEAHNSVNLIYLSNHNQAASGSPLPSYGLAPSFCTLSIDLLGSSRTSLGYGGGCDCRRVAMATICAICATYSTVNNPGT